jgi:hypothetical protein
LPFTNGELAPKVLLPSYHEADITKLSQSATSAAARSLR